MQPVKAVLFDVGGVLIAHRHLLETAFEVFKVKDRKQFWRLFNEAAMPACRGEESLRECWQGIARTLGVAIDNQALNRLWVENFLEGTEVNTAVYEIARELRRHYKVGIISNSIGEHSDQLAGRGYYTGFDPVVLSHEVRLTKDDPAIFELALERLGTAPGETAFVDDVDKFVDCAAACGLHAIRFEKAPQLRRDLCALGYVL